MEKQACIGCRTSFQDSERLPSEDGATEYEDFEAPLREDKTRWAVLRTIVSFLNSEGGALYLGIKDGLVRGQKLASKEQDGFKLSMKQLLEKIHPKIDLIHRQEVAIQFVPILRTKQFEGKYVIKVIVQQGDPSRVYYFGERIKLEGQTGKQDEFEVYYAYERDSTGATMEIRGGELLEIIHKRGMQPREVVSPHEGCHPEPPHILLKIHKIYFSNTSKDHFPILDSNIQAYFGGIEYESYYIEQERAFCMDIDDEEEFKLVQEFIAQNIGDWNKDIFKNFDLFFEVRGEKDNYFLFENNPQAKKPIREQKSIKREEKVQKESVKAPAFNPPFNSRREQKPQPPKQLRACPPNNFPKKFALTFIHINPHLAEDLQHFLMNSICRNMEKYSTRYINTIEIFLGSERDRQRYAISVNQCEELIAAFGNKSALMVGINTGYLRIMNYDKYRRDEMIAKLQAMMGNSLKDAGILKEGKQFSFLLEMRDRATACEWLDNLLQGRHLWEFNDPRSQRKVVVRLELMG